MTSGPKDMIVFRSGTISYSEVKRSGNMLSLLATLIILHSTDWSFSRTFVSITQNLRFDSEKYLENKLLHTKKEQYHLITSGAQRIHDPNITGWCSLKNIIADVTV